MQERASERERVRTVTKMSVTVCVCMCVFPEHSEARQRREVQPSSLSYYKTTNYARHGQKSPLLGPHQQNPNTPKKPSQTRIQRIRKTRRKSCISSARPERLLSHLLALGSAGTSTDSREWKTFSESVREQFPVQTTTMDSLPAGRHKCSSAGSDAGLRLKEVEEVL